MTTLSQLRFTLYFCILLEVILHLFSLTVSARPLLDFMGEYFPVREILWLVTGTLLVVIEIAVWRFPEMALRSNGFTGLKVTMIAFSVIFIALSMFLTTLGAGRVALTNLNPMEYVQEDSTMRVIKSQLAADRERIEELSALALGRKWKVNTETEAAELARLQARVDDNNRLIREQMASKQAKNSQIESQNNAIAQQTEEAHSSFGFLTQIFLLAVMVARFYVESVELKLKKGNRRETRHPEKEYTNETSVALGETRGKPLGNRKETTRQRETDNEVSISQGVIDQVVKLCLEGYDRAEISEKLQVNKGTISKSLYAAGIEYCNNGSDPAEVAERLGIDESKLRTKLLQAS